MIQRFSLVYFADQCESVAERDDYLFDIGIGSHHVVEATDSGGLRVGEVVGFDHMAIPEGIVGDEITAGCQESFAVDIIFGIAAFVGIEKYHIV